MPNKCRTGCGQQVIWFGYEFSDEFMYDVPLNLDKTIHRCVFEDIIEDNPNQWDEETRNLVFKFRSEGAWLSAIDYSTKEALDYKIRLSSFLFDFPLPFSIMHKNDETGEIDYQLTNLAKIYELEDKPRDALLCYQLQHLATKDQLKNIARLFSNGMILPNDMNDPSPSVKQVDLVELIKKVESNFRKYILKKLGSEEKIKDINPSIWDKAHTQWGNHMKLLGSSDKKTVLDFIDFGHLITIFSINRNWYGHKINEKQIISRLREIKNARNLYSHTVNSNFEVNISEDEAGYYRYLCKTLLDFFAKEEMS